MRIKNIIENNLDFQTFMAEIKRRKNRPMLTILLANLWQNESVHITIQEKDGTIFAMKNTLAGKQSRCFTVKNGTVLVLDYNGFYFDFKIKNIEIVSQDCFKYKGYIFHISSDE